MATVQNVSLQFQLGHAETIPAGNQHVYLDSTPGSMTHYRTNAQGTLMPATGSGSVTLDDSRDYHVVAAPDALTPAPTAAQGATVRIRNRAITIAPHIRVQINRSGGSALAGLPCELTIGTRTSAVTTTRSGVVWSNTRTAGAVTLRSDTKLLKSSGSADPQVTLGVNPTSITRGAQAAIAPHAPAATVGLKITEWQYEIAHSNPDSATALTATVTRPASENPSTFAQRWEGILCASGTAKAKFVVGVSLRASGATAIAATVEAKDPVETSLAVTVAARTGTAWEANLTEHSEQSFTRQIASFADLGEHIWTAGQGSIGAPTNVTSGPNKGCQFLSNASAPFTSTPKINTHLTNAASTFAQAQDKAYLLSPPPLRVIPRQYYSVGAQGAITITNMAGFQAWEGTQGATSYRFSAHCIALTSLQTGTRRHEHTHPDKSHKANCLKALRALDPVRYAEALVKIPGQTLNFHSLVQDRVRLVVAAAPTHDVVDESRSRASNSLEFIPGQHIPDCNADPNGALIAPVWNPTANAELS